MIVRMWGRECTMAMKVHRKIEVHDMGVGVCVCGGGQQGYETGQAHLLLDQSHFPFPSLNLALFVLLLSALSHIERLLSCIVTSLCFSLFFAF